MKRFAHMTDTHLELLASELMIAQIGGRIREEFRPDICVITGDVSSWGSMERCLLQLHEGLMCPIAFVLGNHDFRGITWPEGKRRAELLARKYPFLTYLSPGVSVPLVRGELLVGQDGWYDVMLGHKDQAVRSKIVLGDLKWVGSTEHLVLAGKKGQDTAVKAAQAHAMREASEAKKVLEGALSRNDVRRVYFATHVPPFAESAWHQSAPSDERWLPLMTSKAMGDTILSVASRWLHKEIVVLCGHTHSIRRYEASSNVTVYTGHSGRTDYGSPDVSHFFDLEET